MLHGCIRPPGSPHKSGGYQELNMSLSMAYDVAKRPNRDQEWATIRADLKDKIAGVRALRLEQPLSVNNEALEAPELTGRMSRSMQQISPLGPVRRETVRPCFRSPAGSPGGRQVRPRGGFGQDQGHPPDRWPHYLRVFRVVGSVAGNALFSSGSLRTETRWNTSSHLTTNCAGLSSRAAATQARL